MSTGVEMMIRAMTGIDPEQVKASITALIDQLKATEIEVREKTSEMLDHISNIDARLTRLEKHLGIEAGDD